MLTWWRSRSNAARFDLFMRSTFYLNHFAWPGLLIFGLAGDLSPATAAVVISAVVVHAALCLWLTHRGIDHYLRKAPFPGKLLAATALATVALIAAGTLALPSQIPDKPDAPGDGIKLFVVLLFVTTLSTVTRPRTTAAVTAASIVFLFITTPLVPALSLSIVLIFFTAVFRTSVWMLGVMWELERSREVRANLAVAEERLRFARDLHDVVGRNLSVVALKAELAAQLAKRGRSEAVTEMLEVRRIAQDSLDELRAVVSGYRTADLTVELGGARSLLASAGIDCRVIGEVTVTGEMAGALGWAVREGVTNVLRHSQARTCTISLRGKVLTMSNDGVTLDAVRFGSGLTGLRERVSALGGSVTAVTESPNRFVLTVELP